MSLRKTRIVKADGRWLWHYTSGAPPETIDLGSDGPSVVSEGLELRRHPLLDEWVMVAPERQERTLLPPADYCPLCPTRDPSLPTEVPSPDYSIVVFENRFPGLQRQAPAPGEAAAPSASERAAGACEVVLYSSRHDATLAELPPSNVRQLVDVWTDRYRELSERPEAAYVFIFENRGAEVGVTLTHPHGQIYAFPYVPPRVEREVGVAARYRRANRRCLQCDVLAAELQDGRRIVIENDGFVAFVPYFARYPYEVHIVSRRHRPSLLALTARERTDLAALLQALVGTYDRLWDFALPYVMSLHQRPVNGRRYPGWHLRVEFAPRHRSGDRLKYLAGCETAAGTFVTDVLPEDAAEALRRVRSPG